MNHDKETLELEDQWRKRAPKEIWIDCDYFQEDGSIYELHDSRPRVITNPKPESVFYPEGYFAFKFIGFPGEDEYAREKRGEEIAKLKAKLEKAADAMKEGQSILSSALLELTAARRTIRIANQYSDALTALDTDCANVAMQRYQEALKELEE